MKKYTILITALFMLGACELDLKPKSSLTYNGFWDSEEAVYAAHSGIYAKFRDYNKTLFLMGEVRSDNWGGNTIESPEEDKLINHNISSTVVPFERWANFYGLLHYINDFIKNAPKVTFQNKDTKNHLLGQVYGLRAQVYYTMLKAWGEIPISKDPLVEIDLKNLKKPRSSKKDVMEFIKKDIAESLKYFGDNNTQYLGSNVYWSKNATLTLKGDVYLWSGQVLAGGAEDFKEAKEALSSITGHELVANNKLWGQENESNNEFIFAIDYQENQKGNFFNKFTARATDLEPYVDEAGNSMKDFVTNGNSRYGVSLKLLDALKNKNDFRAENFIKLYKNKKYVGSIFTKFLGNVGNDGIRKYYNNYPIYRYADVILLLAEAKNQLGEDPSEDINKIRERAYGTHYTDALKYSNNSKAENTKAILLERQKEFVGEGKRWWDLVRAGGDYVFDEVAKLKKEEAYKIYYPISESMIADDPELKQTAGY